MWVTFQIKPCDIVQIVGVKTKYYAVSCDNDEQFREITSYVYGIDGVTYIRKNKNGKFKHKETKILSYEEVQKI